MSITLTGGLTLQTSYNLKQLNTGQQPFGPQQTYNYLGTFANGVSAGKVDNVYSQLVNVPLNSSLVVNLANASVNNPLNLPITAIRVKAICIQLISTSQDNTNGTACDKITWTGLSGTTGFMQVNSVGQVFSGGMTAHSTPSAAGVTNGLSINLTNPNTTVNASVLLTVFPCNS